MRRGVAVLALLVGAVVGYSATVVFGSTTPIEPSSLPLPGTVTTGTAPAGPASTTLSPDTSTTTTPAPEASLTSTYLVWSTGGLPPTLTEGLLTQFDQVSIVKGDVVELAARDDKVIPLDALAIDPDKHRPFDPEWSLASLRPGTVILSEASARIRRAGVGDPLTLAGDSYEIVAIVPDEAVAAAEVVFAQGDPTLPIKTDRYALVATALSRPELEAAVRSLYAGPAPLRIRSEGETPWFRHGDAVLPQVFIKEALGEFSYTNRTGPDFDQDPAFFDERIVTTEVPILGEVACHETVTDMLFGAMTEVVDQGLSHLVDPAGYAGCWYPRFTRTATGSSAGLSRHSWGAAVDINAPANSYGSAGTQDRRLVDIMQSWGFTWGGDWLVPDPMHFEYGKAPG